MSSLERNLYMQEVHKPKTLGRKISDAYFEPKFFERSGRLYECLGVRSIKKGIMSTVGILHKTLGEHKYAGSYFVGQEDRSVDALRDFEAGTRFNESVHLFFGLYSASSTIYNFMDDSSFFYFNGALTLANIACVMVQRYNRARVYNTIEQKLEMDSE